MRCGDFRTSYAADTTIFESSYSRNAVLLCLVTLAALPAFARWPRCPPSRLATPSTW